jgi:anti-anti-sigma factor
MIESPHRASEPTSAAGANADDAIRCDVLYVGEHAVVAPVGEIDLASAPVVQRAAFGTLALPIRQITIDLAGVGFLDSSGLNMLLRVQRRASELGIGFAVVSAAPAVQRVLRVTHLAEILGVELDEEPRGTSS